ncbi:MAG TPA: hypothetical protein VIV57_01620 [Anaeromyxobacter sp.]
MSELAQVLLALLLPAAAAWTAMGRLGILGRSAAERLAAAVLALLAGAGVASLWTFGWLLAGGTLGPAFRIADVLLWAGAAAALGLSWRIRSRREPGGGEGIRRRLDPVAAIAIALLALAFVLAALRFARVVDWLPHGDYDAWAIWNHRARCVLRWSGGPAGAFDGCTAGHLEYPLLLPLSVARLWAHAGDSTAAPVALAFGFTLAGAAAVALTAGRIAGPLPGAAAGLFLLGTPTYPYWGAVQMADVPLSAILAAAMGALLLADREAGRRRDAYVALGGLLLGLTAWTKNEGLAAAAIAAAVRLAFAWRSGGRRAAGREAALVAMGASLPAAAWLAFHLGISPAVAPELSSQSAGDALAKLADAGRWDRVLAQLGDAFPGRGVGLPLAVLCAALLLGARPRTILRSEAVWTAAAMYLVYVLVFVSTPRPLEWHLDTAALRLALQPWPTLILGLLASTGDRGTAEDPASARAPALRSRRRLVERGARPATP